MSEATPAVIRAIVAHETPKGWTVKTGRTKGTSVNGIVGIIGCTQWHKKTIVTPRLVNYTALWIFFHELGHAVRMIAGEYKQPPNRRGEAGADEEYFAETFAMRKMREYGFRVDRLVLAEAKAYVRSYVERDDRTNWPVARHVRKWAK